MASIIFYLATYRYLKLKQASSNDKFARNNYISLIY